MGDKEVTTTFSITATFECPTCGSETNTFYCKDGELYCPWCFLENIILGAFLMRTGGY